MTAGQKEGIIPENPITIIPEEKVIDFRPKVVPSDVFIETLTDLVEQKAPAGDDGSGDDKDPKGADSSVTGNATPSEGESSESGGHSIPSPTSPTSPSFLSEFQGNDADAEKAVLRIREGLSLTRTTGVVVLPVETTGEAPAAA